MFIGKTALVTGSTSGIGLGIARSLAAQGANIVLNGFGDAGAIGRLRDELAERHGVQVRYDGADMSRPEAIAALTLAGTAFAGECPADQAAANALPGAATAPVGVTDTELAAIDLSKENVRLDQRRLRMRHMSIAPGGVVPLHSHEDRPALIMVNSGEIYEYSSKCAAPVLHKAGDIAREFLGTRHWWKNLGAVPVELTIADVVNDKKPATMEKMM